MLAWPVESRKRSRFGQLGSLGEWLRYLVQSVYAIAAIPIGAPGWPELAFWTASIDSVRMVLIASRSSFPDASAIRSSVP